MPPYDHNGDHRHDHLSARTVHDLRAPLTVIRAQAQMLARWVNRHDPPQSDVALKRLETIDTLIMELTQQLEALHTHDPPDDT